MSRTGIVICNYNMPERTNALVDHIVDTVRLPYNLCVVDNGSDLTSMSKFTALHLYDNLQTTNGFMEGLGFLGALSHKYDYYWLIITSAAFIENDTRDPLQELVSVMESDPLAYAVQPSIIFDGDEAWSKMMSPRKNPMPRRVWGIDYISTLFRAEYFDQIGRYRKELTMMWGVPGECNWKARKNGWHIYVHDGYTMRKETNIGYKMNRMNMTAKKRRNLASAESDRILEPIYGKDYRERFGYEFRETTGEY